MFDKLEFKLCVVRNGKTMKEVAQAIGVDVATLYRKMNGISDFYREEIQTLCEFLKIRAPSTIFFARKITETKN